MAEGASVYATNGQSQLAGRHTCQLMMKSMVEFIKKQPNFTFGTFDVELPSLKIIRRRCKITWAIGTVSW